MKMSKLKNRIKSWCRYWHFNIIGVFSDNDGHGNYLSVVSLLDEWFDTDTWGNDTRAVEEAWPFVLANINRCDIDQLNELSRMCTANINE